MTYQKYSDLNVYKRKLNTSNRAPGRGQTFVLVRQYSGRAQHKGTMQVYTGSVQIGRVKYGYNRTRLGKTLTKKEEKGKTTARNDARQLQYNEYITRVIVKSTS